MSLEDAHQSNDSQSDAAFDFTSQQFDAAAVLRDREKASKQLPCPNAKTFNNLNEYSNKSFKKQIPFGGVRKEAEAVHHFTAEQIAACVRPEKIDKAEETNVLTRMQSQTGPLKLLQKSIGLRMQVKIRRRKAGPPGAQFASLTGLLVAFDKHFNLILQDVDEVISLLSHKVPNERQQLVQRKERHVSRMFIRGDSVVIVRVL